MIIIINRVLTTPPPFMTPDAQAAGLMACGMAFVKAGICPEDCGQ